MIRWEFSMAVQEKYYDEVVHNLKGGRYQKMGFYLLPYLPEKFRSRVVYLPRQKDFEGIYKNHKREIEKLKGQLEVQKDSIMELIKKLGISAEVELVVSVQLTGSMGSFDIENKRIVVRPRFDRSWYGVVKLIVMAVTKYLSPELNDEGLQKMVDDNTQKLSLPGKSLRQILYRQMAGKYIEESCDYIKEWGVPTGGGDLDLNRLKLTKKESLLFDLLQRHKNKLVDIDLIAETIWGELVEKKYSLFAISKLVDRLRRKIYESCGKNIIHSQRGKGYVLQG